MHEPDLPPPRHEAGDVGLRLIWIGVPTVVLGVLLLSWLVLRLYHGGTEDRTLQLPLPHFPAPELQPDPVSDLNRLRATQRQQLDSLGWIDATHQLAHIPIADAMERVTREGIADWPAPDAGAPDAR